MFIDFETHDAKYNMDFDAELLTRCENENIDFALRFYAWATPSITLGRNQTVSGVDEEFCSQSGIPIVKRVTGGRALLHDKEITYCVVCNKKIMNDGNSVMADYKQISGVLLKALNECGIKAEYGEKTKSNVGAGYCMNLSTICDINYQGKKLIGSAQYRRETHILQHGSIPYLLDRELLKKLFPTETDFSHITALHEINPNFDMKVFMDKLKVLFFEEFSKRS